MDRKKQDGSSSSLSSGTALLALVLSGTSVLMAVLSGFGSRWGLWHFRFGFKVLMVAALCGVLSVIIALAGVFPVIRKGMWKKCILFCISIALGITAFGVPLSWYLAARHLPRIHDITTDTEKPPLFVAIIPLRKDAPNSPVYGGPDIALKQRGAYPDIKPLVLDMPPDDAFDRALSVARRMSWKIVDADRQEMRIEATDMTFWFGFKDDIVIRITPADTKSRIDVRSESRVGISDVGTNAARIRKYLGELSSFHAKDAGRS